MSVYTLPLAFGFASIGLTLRGDRCLLRLASAFFAFIACGGALDLTVFVLGTCLVIVIYRIVYKCDIKIAFSSFFGALCGTIMNVFAPGNWVRHDVYLGGNHISRLLFDTFVQVLERNYSFLCSYYFSVVLIIIFALWNYMVDTDFEFVNPFVLIILALICETAVDFTVTMGYNMIKHFHRTEFISKNVMVLLTLVILIDACGWGIKKFDWKKIEWTKQYTMIFLIVIVLSLRPFSLEKPYTKYFPFKIYNDYFSGELTKFDNANNLIQNRLEDSELEKDVVIEVYEYGDIDYIKSMDLTEDPKHWINEIVADYYQKDTISVVYK